MQSFRGVHSAVHAGVAGLCWWVFHHLDELQIQIAEYKQFAIPAVLAGLAVLFRASYSISNIILEKIPLFSAMLRRVLSASEYIEGDWPLIVADIGEQKLLYHGFLQISFKNGQLSVEGDDWNPDGTRAHSFCSKQSLYSEHMLQYWYEQGASLHQPEMRGYTEIFFFPRHGFSERLSGKFLDAKHMRDIRFYARRRRYRLFERRLSRSEDKIKAAQELWLELEPRLPSLARQEISVDFN